MNTTLPSIEISESLLSLELNFQLIAIIITLLGILTAYQFFLRQRSRVLQFENNLIYKFLSTGWGFDWLYDKAFVMPAVFFSRINKNDFIDKVYTSLAWSMKKLHFSFSKMQTGKLRWYAAGLAIGSIITLTIAVFI
jgi:NADH-quinone oxidoreductase subunit L